ncbi:STM2901 family protein [Pantoea sp. App145]|uniref:STM2901 family protein n=1 Tax=Pantoea sp. App145 TaxID=3071567 RepID=UPI003A803104
MDTTEQLNGKYFFDGMSVDKDELLLWLILDEFTKTFTGITDIVAVASMLASVPFVPVSGKLDARRATSGTSPLSLFSRTLIRQRFKKAQKTITWSKMWRGEWAYTTSVGAYIGRWVPWIGAVITMYDLSIITHNVVRRYRLITGE